MIDNLEKDMLYRVTMISGIDSFDGQYELTTDIGSLCFFNYNADDYVYIDTNNIFDIKEIE